VLPTTRPIRRSGDRTLPGADERAIPAVPVAAGCRRSGGRLVDLARQVDTIVVGNRGSTDEARSRRRAEPGPRHAPASPRRRHRVAR
jgi:hypothetical protein